MYDRSATRTSSVQRFGTAGGKGVVQDNIMSGATSKSKAFPGPTDEMGGEAEMWATGCGSLPHEYGLGLGMPWWYYLPSAAGDTCASVTRPVCLMSDGEGIDGCTFDVWAGTCHTVHTARLFRGGHIKRPRNQNPRAHQCKRASPWSGACCTGCSLP